MTTFSSVELDSHCFVKDYVQAIAPCYDVKLAIIHYTKPSYFIIKFHFCKILCPEIPKCK